MTEQANNTVLRESENNVYLEGLLLEKVVRDGKTNDGREFLSVRLQVEIAENEQHQVELFSMKLKQDGTENGIYTSLRTVADEYKDVATHGREEADRVRIDQARIQLNDYVNDRGLQSFPQINATFVNRVSEGDDYNPHTKFEVECVVDRVIEEIKNDEETGRAVLHTYIPLYGGKIIPFQFVVNEDGAEYVLDNYEKGDTVFVYGKITNFREVKETVTQGAFGADNKKVTYNYIREWEVTGGSEAYEEDSPKAINLEAVKKALTEREVYLEGLKTDFEKRKNNNVSSGRKTGFDTTRKNSPKPSINDDDLPF